MPLEEVTIFFNSTPCLENTRVIILAVSCFEKNHLSYSEQKSGHLPFNIT